MKNATIVKYNKAVASIILWFCTEPEKIANEKSADEAKKIKHIAERKEVTARKKWKNSKYKNIIDVIVSNLIYGKDFLWLFAWRHSSALQLQRQHSMFFTSLNYKCSVLN